MIANAFIVLITMILNIFTFILPKWSLWPMALTNGLNYVSSALAKFNFIIPIDTLFDIIKVLTGFFSLFLTVKIIMSIFNFFRGAGKGLDV
jgi:hypothetical protein